jgi:hypothetical protein
VGGQELACLRSKSGVPPGDSGAVSLLACVASQTCGTACAFGLNLSSGIFLVELGTVGLGILQGRT